MRSIFKNINLFDFKERRLTISVYVVILLSVVCCKSVKKTNNLLEGLWVGTYAHEVYRVHYPVLIEFKANGTATKIDFRRQIKDQIVSWSFRDSTLTIDTITYRVNYLKENELSLFKGYEIKLQRPQKSPIKINESNAKRILIGKSWQKQSFSDDHMITSKNYYFVENTKLILKREYWNEGREIGSEYETFDYLIKQYEGKLFFVKQGTTNEFNIRQAQLEQILEMDDDYFLTFQAGNSPTTSKYLEKKMDALATSDDEFKICYLEPLPEYFSIQLKYKGGFREIKRIFSENYTVPLNSKNQTGYLRIRFAINCEGKPGRFNVKGYDMDLKTRRFNAEITNQLFELTRKLDDWEMSSAEKKADCNRFITFKLEDGVITEILP